MKNPIFLIENNEKVRDRRTGFLGIVTARTEWSNGCIRYSILPKGKTDKQPEDAFIDQADLEVYRNGKWRDPTEAVKKKPSEGHRNDPKFVNDPKLR